MEVLFFDNKVKQFIKQLDHVTAAKVFRTLEVLERFGHTLGMPHSKSLGTALFELRVRGSYVIKFVSMEPYKRLRAQLLKKKEFRKSYEETGPEFALVQMIIEKRIQRGLTQAALARKVGTKQSAISRLESGTYNPSFAFLERVAKALDSQLMVSLV